MIKKSLAILCLVASTAVAQSSQTIKLIVGFPAGGANDVAARQIAKDITEGGGPTVVVENKVGASGNIAIADVTNTQSTDVPRLFLSSNAMYIGAYITKTVNFDIANRLQPVSFIGTTPMVLVTGRESNIYNLADIVKSQKKLTYGTGGVNSLTHASMEYLNYILSTPMTHVPYAGSVKALPDLVEGRIDVCFDFYNSSRSFIQSGKLRAIAVTGDHRLSDLPNVPTLKEKGITWPLDSFFMLYSSTNLDKDTTANIQRILNQAYIKNHRAYELQDIYPDLRKNKDVEQLHKELIKLYQTVKIPMAVE
jgi:tripartite-type tricarboxylate transporter receptor subunit TctC